MIEAKEENYKNAVPSAIVVLSIVAAFSILCSLIILHGRIRNECRRNENHGAELSINQRQPDRPMSNFTLLFNSCVSIYHGCFLRQRENLSPENKNMLQNDTEYSETSHCKVQNDKEDLFTEKHTVVEFQNDQGQNVTDLIKYYNNQNDQGTYSSC